MNRRSSTISPAIFAYLFFGVMILFPRPALAQGNMDLTLLLDNSGSMSRLGGGPGNDADFMRVSAVQYLLEKMAPGDRVALITFDSAIHEDPTASHLTDVPVLLSS